jgi:tRNA threonylcarbamoyladenosine biosynthesis protein TsaB
MAAVKGLAEARGLPVVAVSRLAVLAAQAGKRDGLTQAWIDAGRGDLFVGRYRGETCLDERMMRGIDARDAKGDDLSIAEDANLAADVIVAPVGVAEALPLAAKLAAAGAFADAALLDANYLRVPDAELARLAKESAAREHTPQ